MGSNTVTVECSVYLNVLLKADDPVRSLRAVEDAMQRLLESQGLRDGLGRLSAGIELEDVVGDLLSEPRVIEVTPRPASAVTPRSVPRLELVARGESELCSV